MKIIIFLIFFLTILSYTKLFKLQNFYSRLPKIVAIRFRAIFQMGLPLLTLKKILISYIQKRIKHLALFKQNIIKKSHFLDNVYDKLNYLIDLAKAKNLMLKLSWRIFFARNTFCNLFG